MTDRGWKGIRERAQDGGEGVSEYWSAGPTWEREILPVKGAKNGTSGTRSVSGRKRLSAADAAHGSTRLDKVIFTDMVALFLLPDNLSQIIFNFGIGISVAEHRL